MAPQEKKTKRVRALLIAVAVMILLPVVALIATLASSEDRPTGIPGAQADALAEKMMAAVDIEAWKRTGAIKWDFGGRQKHLWDRKRHLVQVKWEDHEAIVDLNKAEGRVWKGDAEITGPEVDALVLKAHNFWINDAFWLNPLAKLHDEGVTRALVVEPDTKRESLLITYGGTGGATPGDAYLWQVDGEGVPQSWKMWVSIIPIGGLEATWRDWKTLKTGAKIATTHEVGPLTLVITDVEGTEDLKDLVDEDPFCRLASVECP